MVHFLQFQHEFENQMTMTCFQSTVKLGGNGHIMMVRVNCVLAEQESSMKMALVIMDLMRDTSVNGRKVLHRERSEMMKMHQRNCALALCFLLINLRSVYGAELVVIRKEEIVKKPDGAQPVQRFQTGLGKLLADKMKRTVRYLDLPRKRFSAALDAGEGDVLCGYQPEWLPDQALWSHPFIPVVNVIISVKRAKRPFAISDLKGQRIGTLTGFVYPELEKVLGKDFVRDDGPSTESAMRKLAAGRYDYLITTMTALHNEMKKNALALDLYAPLIVREIKTQCALSTRSKIKIKELNAAIDSIVKSGELTELLQDSQ